MAGTDPHVALTARVSKVTLDDGRVVAVKRASENAPVTREAQILRLLHQRGCPVPRVISADEESLVTEWCGDDTVDDLLQRGADVDGRALVNAVRSLSTALGARSVPQTAFSALTEDLRAWTDAFPDALTWLGAAHAAALLDPVIQRAVACRPFPGSLDYTARNVVIGQRGLILLDFAAVGFDWDERRLAQYALSAGAGRPNGRFASALTADAVADAWDPEGIDAHEVLLLLIAAEQLRQVEIGTAHEERAAAWRSMAARKASLLELLRRRLCVSGSAADFRAALN